MIRAWFAIYRMEPVPITQREESMTIQTISGSIRFHWIQLRAALKCEKAGMRHSSGRSAKAAAAKELGMKRTSTIDELIAAITAKLEA